MILAQWFFPRQVRTDGMAIITIALAGTEAATHHSRPECMWVRIVQIIGEDVATLALEEKLV